MTHVFISKLRNSLLLCALATGALVSTSRAVAQGTTVQVQVPFAFENGSQHLLAGKYTIELQSEHLILLRGTAANSAGFAMTISDERLSPPQKGKIVFHKYRDHYFLREVWVAGESTGRHCITSRTEKQFQIAQNAPAPTNVELALNTPARQLLNEKCPGEYLRGIFLRLRYRNVSPYSITSTTLSIHLH